MVLAVINSEKGAFLDLKIEAGVKQYSNQSLCIRKILKRIPWLPHMSDMTGEYLIKRP